MLGLRDGEALGIMRIMPGGETARLNAGPPPGMKTAEEQTHESIGQGKTGAMELIQDTLSDTVNMETWKLIAKELNTEETAAPWRSEKERGEKIL